MIIKTENGRKKIKIRKGKGKKMKNIDTTGQRQPTYLGYVPGAILPPKAPTFWETDIEVVKSCGVITRSINVVISPKARSKMTFLMNKFQKTEWLAYLVGDKGTNTVEDIIIPKQRVTSVRVVVDGTIDVPVIGVIHSHHDMGNGFSHTDDEYINQNHDISLCITHNKITGHVRVLTECNRYSLATANVIDQIVGFEPADFEKEIAENITEIVIPSFYPGLYGQTVNRNNAASVVSEAYDDIHGFEDDYDPNLIYKKYLASRKDDDLMNEISFYMESIQDMKVDEFYMVEFGHLVNYIESIGTPHYDLMEEAAFSELDNVFTEPYYRLIDEISVRFDTLSERESVALNKLAKYLSDAMTEYNGSSCVEPEAQS